MLSARVRKLNSLIRDQLSSIIYDECDWTHHLALSVTEVDTAPDLSNCKARINLFGDEKLKKEVLLKLRKLSGHFRYILAKRIEIRKVPLLNFELDDSIETEARVLALIDQVKPKE